MEVFHIKFGFGCAELASLGSDFGFRINFDFGFGFADLAVAGADLQSVPCRPLG